MAKARSTAQGKGRITQPGLPFVEFKVMPCYWIAHCGDAEAKANVTR